MKLKFQKWKPIAVNVEQQRVFFINQRATDVKF